MLTFDFTFKPFDMSICYQQTRNFYNWGWSTKEDLQKQVVSGLLPASEYESIVGEKYEKPIPQSV